VEQKSLDTRCFNILPLVPSSSTRKGGGTSGIAVPPNTPKSKFKQPRFCRYCIMISKVLRDLPFSRNQPLKSVDEYYVRILKHEYIKLKKGKKKTGHRD
jgi:hypothetical protein